MSKLISKMRQCLTAPPGQKLVIVDSAQIEARITFWLAGQADAVDAFRQGRDIYSEFAAEVFAAPCRKARKDDPPPVAKLYSTRRSLGKVGILGLGYGMGADRMLEYIQTFPDLAPLVESGYITRLTTGDIVSKYRRKYGGVPRLWNDLERAFYMVTKYAERVETVGCLKLWRDGSTTVIQLPSTRCLFYPHAKVSGITSGDKISFHWGKLWGGILCENAVQAISRDILAEAILTIDPTWPVVHHLYDEIVAMAEDLQAQAALDFTLFTLRRTPEWATGLPLDAEGKICQKYEK
jgi:DNA polymerase